MTYFDGEEESNSCCGGCHEGNTDPVKPTKQEEPCCEDKDEPCCS